MTDTVDLDLQPEPDLNEIINNTTLKWIFVGGKGGVGKTTTTCCLATQIARKRESVLVISTDPAHNLSDAFGQQFTKEPTKVEGVDNLYCMEISPKMEDDIAGGFFSKLSSEVGIDTSGLQELALTMPGIDEAMSFAEVLKLVNNMRFSVVLFDTAPTGHTLRFLQFPALLEKTLGKFSALRQRFSGLFSQFSSMMGMPEGANEAQMAGHLDATRQIIQDVSAQFKNPDLCTFICVCIPEFLSLYETERLVQELANVEIDTNTIVINQVLFPEKGKDCGLCLARREMQQKYIDQYQLLYGDFHVAIMPMMKHEIRGLKALQEFSELLVHPYIQE